jgi:Tfp pilus assembly protein PilF
MRHTLTLLFIVLIGTGCVSARAKQDTLQIVSHLRDQGKYKKAAALLQVYHAHYPKDINALWLYAQMEFWMKHFRMSQRLYEQAILLQPDKDYLLLDYAHSLLGMGEWKKADKVIKDLENRGRSYSDQLLSRATISYYKGDYDRARSEAAIAIDSNTQSKAAKQLYNDIMLARSPWVKVGASYSADNQPLKIATPSADAGIYLHPYSSLQVSVTSPVFIRSPRTSDAQTFTVGNTSSFKQIGLLLKGDIGIDKFPVRNTVSWTGDIYLQETFVKYLVFDALAEYKPYLYTYSSIDSALSAGHFVSTLGWSDQSFINGKLGFDLSYFRNANYVYTLYGYVFAPPIKFSIFQLRLGYGYSYSDSKTNDYTSTRPLDTIIKNFATTPAVSGTYAPYFTPSGQQVHSALISLRLNPTKNIDIGGSGNIGFYAYNQNPYLYLNKNASSEIYIATGYARENYHPIDAGAYVQWQFVKKYSIKADYRYRSTYFYTSHSVSLSLKISIWKS